MSHTVYSCRLRFRESTMYVSLELHTPRQILCKHFHANSETLFDIICFGLLYICMSSRVPKGIVFCTVDCSILINFAFTSDKLDPRRSAGIVFWRENRHSSSLGLELTSFRFYSQCIHHLATVHSRMANLFMKL